MILKGADTPRGRAAKKDMMAAWPEVPYVLTESANQTAESFTQVMEFFVKNTGKGHLLLVDGHSTHAPLEALLSARSGGVDMFSLVPHSSHGCQPVDVGVAAPFKKHLANAVDMIQLGNKTVSGEPVTARNIMRAAKIAWQKTVEMKTDAVTGKQSNAITGGFKGAGIFPFTGKISDPKMSSAAMAFDEMVAAGKSAAAAGDGGPSPTSPEKLAAVKSHTAKSISSSALTEALAKTVSKRKPTVPGATLLTGDEHVAAALANAQAKADEAEAVEKRREERKVKKEMKTVAKATKMAVKAAKASAPKSSGKRNATESAQEAAPAAKKSRSGRAVRVSERLGDE